MVMPRSMTNKMLAAVSVCCVVSALTLSCLAKNDSAKTYERPYSVDWEHGFQEGLGEVEINGKWGFINSSGQVIIKPKFNQVIYPFTEGFAVVRTGAIIETKRAGEFGRLAGKCLYIDKRGRTIWEHPGPGEPFSEGLAAVYVGAKWGILSESFFGAEAKWGFINSRGEMVIPAKYYDVHFLFSEGLATFEDPNLREGYINHAGEVVIEPRYHFAGAFSEGLAAVGIADGGGKGAKFGFINKRGDVIVPLQYDSARSFSEGLAVVERNGKWGCINKRGELVISFEYHYIIGFSEGLAAVKKNKKWGYIDHTGRLVIPFKFDDAESFSEGYATVTLGRLNGYINKKGDFVIEPKFYLASPFTEGFAKVAVGDKLGYIDKQGDYIWEPTR